MGFEIQCTEDRKDVFEDCKPHGLDSMERATLVSDGERVGKNRRAKNSVFKIASIHARPILPTSFD